MGAHGGWIGLFKTLFVRRTMIRLWDTNTASRSAPATNLSILARAAVRDRIKDAARSRSTPIAQIGKVREFVLQAT